MALKNRTDLKSYFVKNAIPTEGNFADLIDSQLNQTQDGVFRNDGEPLTVVAAAADQKRVLRLYSSYPAANPDWMISLNPAQDPANVATTMKPGFGITDGSGRTRLFLDKTSGQIGVGTNTPQAALDVVGAVRASGSLTLQSMIDVSASSTTTNGWLEAIRLSRTEHGAITHPGGKLLFGLHGNRSFYWVDMATGKNVMQLAADTGALTVPGPASFANGSHFDASGNLVVSGLAVTAGALTVGGALQVNSSTYTAGTLTVGSNLQVNGSANTNGALTVSGLLTASGSRLGNICIGGGNVWGNVTYAYETVQMSPANNFRLWFGAKERFYVENTGAVIIRFDQGYWAFQTDGNLVKYNNSGAVWALNLVSGKAGWA